MEEWMREEKLPVNFLPVTITSGEKAHCKDGRWQVPKAQMVKDLICLLEGGRLQISNQVPHADLLREELRHFEKRSTRGGGTVFGAANGRQDDLVMALAMAAWWVLFNRRRLVMGLREKVLD